MLTFLNALLLDSGLLRSGDADEARNAGRDFEDEVFRHFQREGATSAE